jgi:hypothetical protein
LGTKGQHATRNYLR